ncbi:MAG: PrsW family glutamic-type intramembrane protease [Polyangiaceae bacterium]
MQQLLGVALAIVPLAVAAYLWRRASVVSRVPRRFVVAMFLGGVVVALGALTLERLVLEWSGLSVRTAEVGAGGALLATFLLVAPLEEGAKVLVVWPLYAARQLETRRLGITYAASAGAGFASAEALTEMWNAPASDPLFWVRIAVALPAHSFFAGMWGIALGGDRRRRGSWFTIAWLAAVLVHGLFDHIVFGRGPGLLAAAGPLIFAMAGLSWLSLREELPVSGARRLKVLPEPPSLQAMRAALSAADRPVMLHWIAIGALVTLGVVIVSLVSAVFLGHTVGIDFALADESDVRSSGPLVLLGSAVLLAFPLAGFLVAKASAATSVLEPALGAALAIAGTVALLTITSPVTVLIALAGAPVAFALACGGAWFGLAR